MLNPEISLNNNVDEIKQDSISMITSSAKRIIDNLKDGDKTTLKDLSEKVSEEINLSVNNISGIITAWVKEYPGVSVKRGRDGGIHKGERKPRHIDMRPRCESCHQVIIQRSKKQSGMVEEVQQ